MNYDEAIEYMENLSKRGIHPGLAGIKLLCDSLDNPENSLSFIHVVGTNGKGSTSLFISEILKASGKKVGIYASPKVFSELEIIRFNGKNISKNDYARLVSLLSEKNTFGCTRFEVETVLAFLYFKEKNSDIVVLEAGMGGLLDATNIVKNTEACVFTSIGMDHTEYLGDTIEKIAENKAGVIKSGCIVVSTNQEAKALKVIKDKALENSCEFYLSDFNKATGVKYRLNETRFSYEGLKDISISLAGTYQLINACLSIDVCKALNIENKYILKGLKNAKEEGRFNVIMQKPYFVLDGAHNEPASLRLRESLETYFTKKKFIYIMGMLKDKDVRTVVENTVSLASCVFTVATPNKVRTMSSYELADIVKEFNPCVSSLDSIEEAVEMALMMADKDTVIVAFGSLSHLDKVKKAVENRKSIKKDYHNVAFGR